MAHIIFLGKMIYIAYAIVGKADSLVTIQDYPVFYQEIVMSAVAKDATKTQNDIITESYQ